VGREKLHPRNWLADSHVTTMMGIDPERLGEMRQPRKRLAAYAPSPRLRGEDRGCPTRIDR
jgi:hypothetical protein